MWRRSSSPAPDVPRAIPDGASDAQGLDAPSDFVRRIAEIRLFLKWISHAKRLWQVNVFEKDEPHAGLARQISTARTGVAPMNRFKCLAFTMLAMTFSTSLTMAALAEEDGGPRDRGDESFRVGQFAKARTAYAEAFADDAEDGQAALRLGEIAHLANRFEEAERYLRAAKKLLPKEDRPRSLLAEAFYRQDEFAKAAKLLRATGSTAVADKLASFKGITPYEVHGEADSTHVKFAQTDPLPIIKARFNGGDEVSLLIDTGASELYLNPKFAKTIGAKRFGKTTGTFAGGMEASVGHARIDSIKLGEFEVRNVPVHLLDLALPGIAQDGQDPVGIIGTVLFYHFVTTLDYPNGQLVLQRKSDKATARLDKVAESDGTHVMPFWMGRKHFMVTWGQVNGSEPLLVFVDTGLAGGGFTCPDSTIKAAGIDLSGLPTFEGMGGGGPVKVTPFTIDKLALGSAQRSGISAFFGPFPPMTEYDMGFRVGGIISHTFFRPYALTFDFDKMRLFLKESPKRSG